jgi:hypothetical protein
MILEGMLRSNGAPNGSLHFSWHEAPEHGAVYSNDIKGSFYELGDVWPVCLLVTEDDELARTFSERAGRR